MAPLPTNSTPQNPRRTRTFISYSRKDKRYLEEMRPHLDQYARLGLIDSWDDTQIGAGAVWRDEINKAMQSARVGILLISPDFLDSDFILKYELPQLLEAEKNGEVTLLIVILRPCAFKLYKELSEIQTVNPPSSPLSKMSKAQREMVWAELAENVNYYLNL
jgi:internalin A